MPFGIRKRKQKSPKNLGTFTLTGPEGTTGPIPYNASMKKIGKEARKVGYEVVPRSKRRAS